MLKLATTAKGSFGLFVGAVVVVLIHRAQENSSDVVNSQFSVAGVPLERQVGTSVLRTSISDVSTAFTHRVAKYEWAAQLHGRNELVSQTLSALREPWSLDRDLELEVLMVRLFEVQPAYAVSFIQTLDLQHSLLFAIFHKWARIDVTNSMSLLDQVDNPSMERLFALAIVDVVGDDLDLIDTVRSASQSLDADGFEMLALMRRAQSDPLSALAQLSTLASREARAFAIEEIGRIAASHNPIMAVSAVNSIPTAVLRRAYIKAVYEQWSRTDVPQFLEYLATLDPDDQDELRLMGDALALSAESDALTVLEFAHDIGGSLGVAAEAAAILVLAFDDPGGVASYLDSVPTGYRRDALAESIATGYARYNANEALAWVNALSPPSSRAKQAVMTEIASTDLAWAIRIELEDPVTSIGSVVGTSQIPVWFANRTIGDLDDPIGVANQLIASKENGAWGERMLATTLSRWAASDSQAAIAWMRSNPSNVPVAALESVAGEIGATNLEQMLNLTDMLTTDRQPAWIQRATRTAALVDASRAMTVITERYGDDPIHDSLVAHVVNTSVVTNGVEAASQLLGPTTPPMAAVLITSRWAESEPQLAVDWALRLQDEEARAAGVTAALSKWSKREFYAAMNWASSLSDRRLREQAVLSICQEFPEAADCG